MSTMCEGSDAMSDEDETLVLNYLDDELAAQEASRNPSTTYEHVDENQNTSTDIRAGPGKSPKKKGRGRPKRTATKLNGNISNKGVAGKNTEVNGVKSASQQKTSQPIQAANTNSTDVLCKTENFDEDLDVIPNSNVNALVKSEPMDPIQTELKIECLSDDEETGKKKRKVKKSSPKTSPTNIQAMMGQSNLETLLKVIDLKPQCKLPLSNVFKCNHCLYVGNTKANLERHNLIHMDPNDILWYKCTECDYKSKYESQLKSHTLIHKNPEDIQYFQCPHCALKCSRKHNLSHHIRSIHADRVNNLQCAECSYSTFSKDRLVAHMKMHSKEVFMCTMCKFVTKRIEYLETHFKMKHTNVDKPFPCDTCSYKGKTKRELDRHYDRMHNKDTLKSYQCNQCSFNSIYKKNLEFHLLHMHKNSEGFQKFICGHCDKAFAYKNGLKTHIIRIHLKLTDEDWHKCLECKYKCKDVNTLKRHIKRNHGTPRLHCKKCSFATNRQKSMIAHMNAHEVVTTNAILKCPDCPYRIVLTVSFLYHMKTMHGKSVGSKDLSKYHLKED